MIRFCHPVVCLLVAFTGGLLPAIGMITIYVVFRPTRQAYRTE